MGVPRPTTTEWASFRTGKMSAAVKAKVLAYMAAQRAARSGKSPTRGGSRQDAAEDLEWMFTTRANRWTWFVVKPGAFAKFVAMVSGVGSVFDYVRQPRHKVIFGFRVGGRHVLLDFVDGELSEIVDGQFRSGKGVSNETWKAVVAFAADHDFRIPGHKGRELKRRGAAAKRPGPRPVYRPRLDAVPESVFWAKIAEIGWPDGPMGRRVRQPSPGAAGKRFTYPRGKNPSAYSAALATRWGAPLASKIREAYDARYRHLHDVLNEWEDATSKSFDLGDDGFWDLVAHIIGLGADEYEAVLANPERAWKRARRGDFIENFSYYLPG